MFGKLFRRTVVTKTLEQKTIIIDGVSIEISWKKVKNLTLKVKNGTGEVKATAPARMSQLQIEQFILSKINWIKEHQAKQLAAQPFSKPSFKNGELHPFLGKLYPIEISLSKSTNVVFENEKICIICPDSQPATIENILNQWYRAELKRIIPPLFRKYEPVMKVHVNEFGIKKMKTRWGTCNPRAARIWINLEMAKKSIESIEYLVVHEMVHLLEPSHNQRFYRLMTQYLPNWKAIRHELKCGKM